MHRNVLFPNPTAMVMDGEWGSNINFSAIIYMMFRFVQKVNMENCTPGVGQILKNVLARK